MADEETTATDAEGDVPQQRHIKRSQDPEAAAEIEGADLEFPALENEETPTRTARRRRKKS